MDRMQLIEEMVDMWIEEWSRLSGRQREQTLREFVATAFSYLSDDKLHMMYEKLYLGTH